MSYDPPCGSGGQVTQNSSFTGTHNIRYVFKLEGKPTPYPHTPPIIRTRLPDQIEIIAIPCYKSYLDLKSLEPPG